MYKNSIDIFNHHLLLNNKFAVSKQNIIKTLNSAFSIRTIRRNTIFKIKILKYRVNPFIKLTTADVNHKNITFQQYALDWYNYQLTVFLLHPVFLGLKVNSSVKCEKSYSLGTLFVFTPCDMAVFKILDALFHVQHSK